MNTRCLKGCDPGQRAIKAALFAALVAIALTIHAAPRAEGSLADLTLEELAQVKVISASKTERPVAKVPAAIFVVTENDIRRTGSTTLPEALRLAPNLQVARSGARSYAISSRGFNNPLANKMLVMRDGRTLYSHLFSGVFWDSQDVMLEDLARIEVASGPGGTLWGANAVNGVINIVTRSAAETQGPLISLGASQNEEHSTIRYGGRMSGNGHFRVYAKHSEHDDVLRADKTIVRSGWERTQAGFRADWQQDADTFTLQGDVYSGHFHQASTADITLRGANLLGRKAWHLGQDSKLGLQAYYDVTEREQPNAFHQRVGVLDIDIQHEWSSEQFHRIVWGGGYRRAQDRIHNSENFAFLPPDLRLHWRNLFIQDEIHFRPNWHLTLGIKLEDNPYTHWEAMPSARLAWELDPTKLLWGGISRALRSPSRIDRDLYSPRNPPVINGVAQYEFAGGPDFVSEVADVFEMGYRSQPIPEASWSMTAFTSHYDKLRTLEPHSAGQGVVVANLARARTSGLELWGSWQAASHWRLHGGWVVQEIDITLKPESDDLTNATALANVDPDYYGILRSSHDISPTVTLDATLRHVAALDRTRVPAYTALDIRLAWLIQPKLEISLVGQNLLDPAHPEFGAAPARSEYERVVYGKIVWGL